MKREIFAVIWMDNLVGPLSLETPTAKDAITSAASIRAKGIGKVQNVRAVYVAEGSDWLVDLLP